MKYRCRWAQMGLDSQSVNIKNPPEIDFSLWLQFLFVFFPTIFSVRESFRSRRFWDLWWRNGRHQSFFPKTFLSKSSTAHSHSWVCHCVTISTGSVVLQPTGSWPQTAQTKMTRFFAGEPRTSGISSLILRRVWRHVPAWLSRSKSLIISVRRARKRRDDVQEGRGEMRRRGGGCGGGLATAISSF